MAKYDSNTYMIICMDLSIFDAVVLAMIDVTDRAGVENFLIKVVTSDL